MLIVSLNEIDAEGLPLVGGKAAQLGVMLRAGLPVPSGYCVTTEAFRRGMDAQVAAEIASAYDALGEGNVAVRSSATAEDLAEASFAGQQETFLCVNGREAVLEAVRGCWASLRTQRAVAYRRDRGIAEGDVAMAVVVQRMVDAEAAGVLFTLNPVTGAVDEMVIEAARGLGDKVVSARVTPDRYRLRRRAPHEVIEAEARETTALLTPARLAELGQLGLAAERLLGRAADIEWALADGQFQLLQARAVTAAGPRLPEVRYGSKWNEEHCRGKLVIWANHNLRETMPYPHTPFSWSFWNYLVFPSMGRVLGFYAPGESHEDAPSIADLVDGRAYFNAGVMAGLIPFAVQMPLGQLLDAEVAGIVKELYRSGELKPLRGPGALRRVLRALWNARRLAGKANPKYAWEEMRRCREEVEAFRKMELDALSDKQILALARYFATENFPRSLEVLAAGIGAVPALLQLEKLLPRWGFADAVPKLLSGLRNNPTVETALALWDVAASAGPHVRAVFASEAIERVPVKLRESAEGREFLVHMDEFLNEHGHRAVREFDFTCPRWREDPTFLYETVRNYLAHPAGEPTPREHYAQQVREHEEAKANVERGLARRPLRRRLFRWLVRMLEERVPLREAPKFYTLLGAAHVRDMLLVVGRRMVERGVLEKQDDFFFVSIPELERLAEGKLDAAWLRGQIPIRRQEFARHMRANPPIVVRSDGKAAVKPAAGGDVLRGTPVSWGTVRGRARVLMDPGDGALLHKGEVLVAPFTDPGWTPLFLTAGGLVMEIGGMISHGAVVAREYGIPAVVGVKDATRLLRDGEWIEVDGATGEVRRLRGVDSARAET